MSRQLEQMKKSIHLLFYLTITQRIHLQLEIEYSLHITNNLQQITGEM